MYCIRARAGEKVFAGHIRNNTYISSRLSLMVTTLTVSRKRYLRKQ